MGITIENWNKVNVDLEKEKTMLKNILEYNMGYRVSDKFYDTMVDTFSKNKKEIINNLGAYELWTNIEIEENNIDNFVEKYRPIFSIVESFINKIINNSKGLNNVGQYYKQDMARDLCFKLMADNVYGCLGGDNELPQNYHLFRLKYNFPNLEYVQKLRLPLPKPTRLVSNLFTDYFMFLIDSFVNDDLKEALKSNVYSIVNDIISTMGSSKKTRYIVTLSTLPSSIYTASVSGYFQSCYDIRDGGHCYCSSVAHLSCDRQCMIMKVFADTPENRTLLNNGYLSNSINCISRRFVFAGTENNRWQIVLGKGYPNDNTLPNSDFLQNLYRLFNEREDRGLTTIYTYYNECEDEDDPPICEFASYSDCFKGYKDLTQKHCSIIKYGNDNYRQFFIGDDGIVSITDGKIYDTTSGKNTLWGNDNEDSETNNEDTREIVMLNRRISNYTIENLGVNLTANEWTTIYNAQDTTIERNDD